MASFVRAVLSVTIIVFIALVPALVLGLLGNSLLHSWHLVARMVHCVGGHVFSLTWKSPKMRARKANAEPTVNPPFGTPCQNKPASSVWVGGGVV